MDEAAHAKIDSIENVYHLQKNNYQLQMDTINRNLTALSDTIHAQEGILHDEIKGVVRRDDRTTGKAGEGPTFKYDTAYLNRLYTDLAQAKRSNAFKISTDSLQLIKLDSARNAKINRLTFSRDYLEREKALSRLTASNSIIKTTTWFLIIFFMLVDILPVTWKGLTGRGPYDEYLNEIEFVIKNEVQERMIDSEIKLEMHRLKKEKEKNDFVNELREEATTVNGY